MLLVVVIFVTSSHADFVNAYNAYFPGGVPKVFSDAAKTGYSSGASLVSLGAVVPLEVQVPVPVPEQFQAGFLVVMDAKSSVNVP